MDDSPTTHQARLVVLNGEKKASTPGAQAPLVAGPGGLIRLSTAWLFSLPKKLRLSITVIYIGCDKQHSVS